MKVLHIKDAYFELPEKYKDDIGCMVTLFGMHIQRNKDSKCSIQYEVIEREKEN